MYRFQLPLPRSKDRLGLITINDHLSTHVKTFCQILSYLPQHGKSKVINDPQGLPILSMLSFCHWLVALFRHIYALFFKIQKTDIFFSDYTSAKGQQTGS